MNKSAIITDVAGLQDNDPRLSSIRAILDDTGNTERPASLRLLRMCEAVDRSGMSRATIYRLTRDGTLRTVEIRRGSRRIPEADLLALVEGAK